MALGSELLVDRILRRWSGRRTRLRPHVLVLEVNTVSAVWGDYIGLRCTLWYCTVLQSVKHQSIVRQRTAIHYIVLSCSCLCWSECLSVCLSDCVVCVCVCVCVCLSVCLSFCPSVRPSVRPSVCPSVCLPLSISFW